MNSQGSLLFSLMILIMMNKGGEGGREIQQKQVQPDVCRMKNQKRNFPANTIIFDRKIRDGMIKSGEGQGF